MSIATALQNAQAKVAAAYSKCNDKGATMPATQDLAHLDDCIDSIPTGSAPNLQTLNVTPTTSAQQITPTSPVDGYDEVNVSAVTAAIDSNIQAGNIKKDVSILGVTGTYEGNVDPNPVAEDNDVIFIDYDGTIRYSYTRVQFLALESLPPNPVHDGLTAQGWNWTLADAKEVVTDNYMLVIGQNYITTDGKTRLYLDLPSNAPVTVSLTIGASVADGVTVDWGDGSTPEVVSQSGQGITLTHAYQSIGHKVIAFTVAEGCVLYLGGTYEVGKSLFAFSYSVSTFQFNASLFTKIELGERTSIAYYGVRNNDLPLTITMPKRNTGFSEYSFNKCVVDALILPDGVPSGNMSIKTLAKYISVGRSAGNVTHSANQNLLFPHYVKGTSQPEFFLNCYKITKGYIGKNTTSVNQYAYTNTNVSILVVMAPTPPTYSNAYFPGTLKKLYVPKGSLSAYQSATNWSAYALKMEELDANGNIPSA